MRTPKEPAKTSPRWRARAETAQATSFQPARTEPGSRPVSIKDIAKALGISIGTVDRALHSRGGINPITRDRVLKMAQTLGYRPNLAARYLKAPRRLRLTINLPAQIAFFFDAVRSGIRSASGPFEPGVELCFRNHPVLGEGDTELFEQALEDGSKGIIIAPGHPSQLKAWIRRAAQKRVPVVCVATDAPGTERLAAVSADPFTSGGIVAELLSRMVPVKTNVAIFTGDLSTFDHSEKVRGFENGLKLSEGRLKISSVLENHDDATAAYSQARELLLHDRQLRAIYVATANSLGVIRAIEEVDPERPFDIITTDLFAKLVPYLRSGRILATINQRPQAQGRMAFEALYRFLVEGKCPAARIKLNPHIVMRSNLDLFLERTPGEDDLSRPESLV
jgi:LacI family transcriptional regulator